MHTIKNNLEFFLNQVMSGELPNRKFWATIPGGIVIGDLVSKESYEAYIKEILETPEAVAHQLQMDLMKEPESNDLQDKENTDSQKEALQKFAELIRTNPEMFEKFQKVDYVNVESREIEIILINAFLVLGKLQINQPIVRVRLSSIGVWAFGEPIISFLQEKDNLEK